MDKPKKRGRKPKKEKEKEKEIVKEKKTMENMIIRINDKEKEIINDINAYDAENDKHCEISCSGPCSVCWNCCHECCDVIQGLPLKYHKNIFYIYGYFCSHECSARYAYENFEMNKFQTIYPLINIYNRISSSKEQGSTIELAPNRLVLKLFGGDKTIEEYRELFHKKNISDLKIPPILPILHQKDTYENHNLANNSLKLYRKTPVKSINNNICKSMDLNIS